MEFVSYIKKKTNIDLNWYKEAQMKRRITSLRDKHGFRSFLLYYQSLEQDEKPLEELIDRITINVSKFFRNPKR